MEQYLDFFLNRRSVRVFKKKSVSEKDIYTIIRCAQLAPCSGNKGKQKNWFFIAVKNKKIMRSLKRAVVEKIKYLSAKISNSRDRDEFKYYSKYFTFFADAPLVICVVMKQYDSFAGRLLKNYAFSDDFISTAGIQSVASAVENMLLAASALGLGACWMTGPLVAKKKLEQILSITSPDSLFALVPVGYPKVKIRPHVYPKLNHNILKIIE